jgi:hypothetical protein
MRWQFVFGFVAVFLSTGPAACVVVDDDGGDDAGETTMIGDGDGDGDPGAGDGDGDPNCPAGDPGVDFSYESLPSDDTPWWGDENIDWTCTATEVDVSDGLYLVADCPDAAMPIMIDITATPSLLLPMLPGDTIHVRYLIEGGPWFFNRYLRIDVDGHGHLLTMIEGDSLLPPVNYSFETPFPIQLVSGLCALTSDGCGDLERQALAFEVNDEAVEMLDGSHGIIGGVPGIEVWVADAWQRSDFMCSADNFRLESYRVLIANTGSE